MSDEVSFPDIPLSWLRIRFEERQRYLISLRMETLRRKVDSAFTEADLVGIYRDYPDAASWFLAEGELRGIDTAQKILDWCVEDAKYIT